MNSVKSSFSLFSLIAILILAVFLRISHPGIKKLDRLNVINWDAFGYYMYLPSIFIYNDFKDLKWLEEKDSQYNLSGGYIYQAEKQENGKYVFRYFYGVSALQSPFFFGSMLFSHSFDHHCDGFSTPFQWGVALASLTYFIIGMLLMRRVLLNYYNDFTVAVTLLLIALASNLLQYVSRDSGMSHVYSFFLISLLLWLTDKWHRNRSSKLTVAIGFSLGLIAITRPTDAIAFLIPLLWSVDSRKALMEKWKLIKANKDLWFVLIGIIIPVIPQIIYWYVATGSPIYNVGSKWVFLNPWWRVLFGFGNGWFVYTPVAILLILGLFFLKNTPFKKAVQVYVAINIWIVISWIDYTYGATYSTRALIQSYPVLGLALASFIQRFETKKWRIVICAIGAYLVYVNLFQLDQYKNTILHYRDMNADYYKRIYLNRNPNPLDMSLLDSNEVLSYNIEKVDVDTVHFQHKIRPIMLDNPEIKRIVYSDDNNHDNWLIIHSEILVEGDFHQAFLNVEDVQTNEVKRLRLFSPISAEGQWNNYEMHYRIKGSILEPRIISINLSSANETKFQLRNLLISRVRLEK